MVQSSIAEAANIRRTLWTNKFIIDSIRSSLYL